MFKLNITNTENLHPYGDGFNSLDQIKTVVKQRMESGLIPIRGAAVFWPTENGIKVRRPVRILPDGEIDFAHAEYF
jgi:hypothetical protein